MSRRFPAVPPFWGKVVRRARADLSNGGPVAVSAKSSDPAIVKAIREKLKKSGTAKQLGFTVAEAEPGRVVLKMVVKPHHKQIHGVVHGGVLAALADTAGGMSTHTTGLN